MISCLDRKTIFGVAALAMVLFVAGCTSPKPKPAVVEIPPPVVTPTNPPVTTQTMPEVARPRPAEDASNNMAAHILEWDAVVKEYHAAIGETNAPFTFSVTNISPERVMIYDVSTTCECTVAQLPSRPWSLVPGASGELHASLDMHGRTSVVTNYVIVFTSKGNRLLTLKGVPSQR